MFIGGSMNTKVIYFKDELNDEFSGDNIKTKEIGDDYSYDLKIPGLIFRGFLYHIIAKVFGFIFLKIKYGHKVINRKTLMKARGSGYFLVGNHTNAMADPFIPSLIDPLNSVFVIVHPNNVSMPVLGKITPILGAIPLPDTRTATRKFFDRIFDVVNKGKCIMIYPEAHIWPFYTGIRHFKSASFGYAVKAGKPVYCFTNTYQARKFRKIPRIVTYVDGPFFSDSTLPVPKQKEELRDRVYETMVLRSKNSNVKLIEYVKVESDD